MDSEVPKTMQAWTHARRGTPSTVLSLTTLPIPPLLPMTAIRVRITHAALNPGGSIVMHLLPFLFRSRSKQAIPEMDFSGVVDKALTSVLMGVMGEEFRYGAPVFGSIPLSQHVRSTRGALAEYVVVPMGCLVKKPDGMRQEQAAGLGIAGATALELVKEAGLKKGDSVLVNGASGGIGHLVVQMCRAEVGETGRVVGICSGENVGWVGELGCDEVIDYNVHGPVHEYLASQYGSSRFSAVIDAAGIQSIFSRCPAFLMEGKPYVTVGPRPQSYTVLGMLATIGLMARNMLWPRILGGVPREYVLVTGVADF
ncbi:NAD(P)-binding protein [Zopfia rhizophila CBS 207.26]|uniref:NAD(P)-binding protein n=1 Tax=Zopfia rhizophila CBS 207.26 TaxID=1314779 RepID=A0A6A6EWP2_9PEZI|nr:NAD(P)-binding protein [Zopfia rhizophila CBS 207.26]